MTTFKVEKQKNQEGEKFRDRKFLLLLYPDNAEHVKAYEKVTTSYDYASILHNKDTDEDGVLKKEHWHVVITTGKNAIWNTALAQELNIDKKFIEKISKLDRTLEYLIHYNDADKYQYDLEEVKGNLKSRIKASINQVDKTEGEKVSELIKFIEEYEGRLTITKFSNYCATCGYWDIYRRSAIIFIKMIEEHNFNMDKSDKTENN